MDNNQGGDEKKSKLPLNPRTAVIVGIIAVVAIVLFATLLAFLGGGIGNNLGGIAGQNVGLCEIVPDPYQTIFSNAGKKFVVQPAMVAAIFYGGEHNNSWPNSNGPWASSPKGAQGPFQFMPGTWASNKQDGDGDGKMDVQNLTDAAFGASHLLANIGAGGNTTDLDNLRDAASRYNSGRPWAIGQGFHETSLYVPRVIEAFQKFQCISLASLSGPCSQKIVQLAMDAVGNPTSQYYSVDPKRACASFVSTILMQAGAQKTMIRSAEEHWYHAGGQEVIPKGGSLNLSVLQPGDAVYFAHTYDNGRYFGHVGIYVGEDMFVNTSSSKLKVVNARLSTWMHGHHFAGAKRFCTK